MIITNASTLDANTNREHVAVSADGLTDEDWFETGREAGELCGRQFQRAYPPGTNADVRRFFPAVVSAIETAVAQMKATGATDKQTDLWHVGFMAALDPYTAECRQRLQRES